MSVNTNNPKSKHTNASLPDIMSNTPVTTEIKGEVVEGLFSHWTKQNEAYIKLANRVPVWRAFGKFQVTGEPIAEGAGEVFLKSSGSEEVSTREFKPVKAFNINKRFSFLASLVKMVINKQSVSAIITGDGGLGKTKTVTDQITLSNITEGEDYITIKGYSTAKGLYNTLYLNREKLIVFDDCDEVLKNDVSRNILKGALDSYDQRIVHWISNKEDSEIPNEFEFTGRIIFISNMKRHQIHQAIISRSTCIDVSMTIDEKIERMTTVLSFLKQDVSMNIKEEALEVVKKWKNECSDLNFRTLIKVINIRTAAERNGEMEDWEEMAEYMLLS